MKSNNAFFTIFSITLISTFVYIAYNWPYTSEDAISDIQRLGPYGIMLDVIFVYIGYTWWKGRKTPQ